jgi:hypothetical protein
MNFGGIVTQGLFGAGIGAAKANLEDIMAKERRAEERGMIKLRAFLDRSSAEFSHELNLEREAESDRLARERSKEEFGRAGKLERELMVESDRLARERSKEEFGRASDFELELMRESGRLSGEREEKAFGREKELREGQAGPLGKLYKDLLSMDIPIKEARDLAVKLTGRGIVGSGEGAKGNLTEKQRADLLFKLRETYDTAMLEFDDGSEKGGIFGIGSKEAARGRPSIEEWARGSAPELANLVYGEKEVGVEDGKPTIDDLFEQFQKESKAAVDQKKEIETEEKDMVAARDRAAEASKSYKAKKEMRKLKKEFGELARKKKADTISDEELARFNELKKILVR